MADARRLILALLIAAAPGLAHAAAPSPVGTWRTFDDADGKESGTVTIFEKDGTLYGNVASIADPAKAAAVCSQCTGDRKDKPILGLQIIRGLKPDGSEWDGGEIVDPKTGTTYRCLMRLQDGGQKLVVRGYVGISLVGRSQTWVRK